MVVCFLHFMHVSTTTTQPRGLIARTGIVIRDSVSAILESKQNTGAWANNETRLSREEEEEGIDEGIRGNKRE